MLNVSDKYLMIDIGDSRSDYIAEALSNKTSKKILVLLAEHELSESELAAKLGLPLSTVDYNVKKLVRAGLIEKTKMFWSSRGKRIPVYRTSNRKIVISPRKTFSGIFPTVIIAGVLGFGIKVFADMRYAGTSMLESAAKFGDGGAASAGAAGAETAKVASESFYNVLSSTPNSWAWFFIGALAGLMIYVLWNFLKKRE